MLPKKKNLKETKSLALRAYNKYTVWRGTKDIDIYGERLGNSTIFSPLHVIVSFQLFSLFFFWRSCKIVQWFNLTKVVLCCWEVKVLDTRLEALYSLSNVFYLAPQVGHYLSLETIPNVPSPELLIISEMPLSLSYPQTLKAPINWSLFQEPLSDFCKPVFSAGSSHCAVIFVPLFSLFP